MKVIETRAMSAWEYAAWSLFLLLAAGISALLGWTAAESPPCRRPAMVGEAGGVVVCLDAQGRVIGRAP